VPEGFVSSYVTYIHISAVSATLDKGT